ncbi:putative electron transfer flavoprotein FixA [Pectinatus frisingensis]|jgi:electron transfer flavoprotein beta subunit|uniref:putative electron transfer flavoprotein FixA n=1 Tax=Pectinatus frisingensis TaxID=865 RepID=UPI0018C6AB48|nr:putative electron transfer flavoprotein FixA [Pectinatus frisingensis]
MIENFEVIELKIVICYKAVPEEQDILVNSDHTLSFERAEYKIGIYDLNAIEAGVKLGGTVIGLTAGGEIVNNSKMKKSILSRGVTEMYGVMDDSLVGIDSYSTANVLKAAIEKIGDVDLVLCGEGSGDIYSQQVGPILGQLLGWVGLNAVSKITEDSDGLVVERSLESEIEVLKVKLPAVLSVTTDINIPRIPGLRDIMSAGKKSSKVWKLDEVGVKVENRVETLSVLAAKQIDRKKVIIEGDSTEKIAELYEHLRKIL